MIKLLKLIKRRVKYFWIVRSARKSKAAMFIYEDDGK